MSGQSSDHFKRQYESTLKEIKSAISRQKLESARQRYLNVGPSMKRKLRALYGVLIADYKPTGRATYPVVFGEDHSVDLFELCVRRCNAPRGEGLPAPLTRAIRLAVNDHGGHEDWKRFTVEFFPPIRIGEWSSHTDPNLPYIVLDADSDSYSAALYVAARDLLIEREVERAPMVTGCLLEEGRFTPPDHSTLQRKYRVDGSERLKVPSHDEVPDLFYHRIYFTKQQRSISDLQHELRHFGELLDDARDQLLKDALEALRSQRGHKFLNTMEINELYLNTFKLASHLDRLTTLEDLFPFFEARLQSDQRSYFEYICLRINHRLANESADQILTMTRELLARYPSVIKLTPVSHSEVMSQPVELCMVWNTLSQVLWMSGYTAEALKYTSWAITRTEGNYADLLRYRCRRGQLLGLKGHSDASESYHLLKTLMGELNEPEIRQHRGIQSSRVYVSAYLARAAALLGYGEEAHQALVESEREQGSSEIFFVQQEVRFLLVRLGHCNLSEERERWFNSLHKLPKPKRRSYEKLRLIHRVELVRERVEQNPMYVKDEHPIYLCQLEDEYKRCAPY